MDAPAAGGTSTDTDSVNLKLGETYVVDILPADIDLTGIEPVDGVYTLPDGRTVTKTVENGKLTYTITKVSPVEKEALTDAEKEAILDANAGEATVENVGGVYYEYFDYELPGTYIAGSVENADGGRTDTTVEDSSIAGKATIVEKIYDKDGKLVKEITRTPPMVNGKVGYEITTKTYTSTPYTENGGIISSETTGLANRSELPKVLPAPEAVTKDGLTTTVALESILDADGNHVGYKAVTTVTDSLGNTISTSEETIEEDAYIYEADKDTVNNLTTTVSVTKMMRDGEHIGYTTTITVTDANGNIVSRKSSSIERTTYTDGSVTETVVGESIETVTTETTLIVGANKVQDQKISQDSYFEDKTSQTVQKDVYQLIETEDGLYMVFQGNLYKIEGTYEVGESEFVADLDNVVSWDQYTKDDDLVLTGKDSYWTGAIFPSDPDKDNWNKYNWDYFGYGAFSGLEANFNSSNNKTNNKTVRQFMLQSKDGTIIMAYCAEMGNPIQAGVNFSETVYDKGNAEDDATAVGSGTMANLRSIVANGFWGTETGLGSLEAVKELMRRNGIAEEHVEAMTPGMAMVATQVAIWEYARGKKHTSEEFGKLLKGEDGDYLKDSYIDENGNTVWYYTGEREYFDVTTFKSAESKGSSVSQKEIAAIGELRNLLVKLSNNPVEGQVEQITAEKVTGAGIVVKESAGTTSSGKRQYVTDVKFGLDVSTSSLNGDLVVQIIVDGEVVGKARLAGDNDKDHTIFDDLVDGALKTIQPDENGVFTIPGVTLTEGVQFSLNLSGVQHLDDGVYILHDSGYNKTDWQDYVSLTKKDAKVNITMDMDFTATEDPNFTHTTQTWQEDKIDTAYYTKTDSGNTKLSGSWQSGSTATSSTLIGYTSTVTVETKSEAQQREWYEIAPSYPPEEEETPPPVNYRVVINDGGEEIPDERVPLAAAPKTGDNSGLWIVLVLTAMFCLFVINVSSKKRQRKSA